MNRFKFSSFKLVAFFAVSIFFLSCQDENELSTGSGEEPLGVQYLAENYYKQLPGAEVEKIGAAYKVLSHPEMAEFIDARYRINLQEGMDQQEAYLVTEFGHRVNDEIFRLTGGSYASAGAEVVLPIYERLLKEDSFTSLKGRTAAQATERAQAACSPWYRTKSMGWTTLHSNRIQWPAFFVGSYNFEGKSDDCDYVFYSQPYNKYYKTAAIRALTSASQQALGWNGATSTDAAEPLVNSNEAVFEFGVGAGRIGYSYLFQSNPGVKFANDVRVLLIPR
ncbi:MAG: hypothetical protein MJA30_32980 [Cytophagales bacterium]|nr:hypothetical protein [Cytophagales bacterium]